jgi:uncharacterized iron-regulated membrane protein
MKRSLLVTLHMYLSAFFAPFIFLVAISGGLYLFGVKGVVEQTLVFSSSDLRLDSQSSQLDDDVRALLATAGVSDYDFEYVKAKGNQLYTRPTSKDHYVIRLRPHLQVFAASPSLQATMIELHKGHGPAVFKIVQQVFALGLLLIVGSGLWLGLSARRLRPQILAVSAAGTVVFLLLVVL